MRWPILKQLKVHTQTHNSTHTHAKIRGKVKEKKSAKEELNEKMKILYNKLKSTVRQIGFLFENITAFILTVKV